MLFFKKYLLTLVILILFNVSCSSNTVRLVSSPDEGKTTNAMTSKVYVVLFSDTRQRSDGSSFMASSQVRDWVTKQLIAELLREDVAAVFAIDEATAKKNGAAYIVKGAVQEVMLVEHASLSYSCSMRTSIKLLQKDTPLLNTSFNSRVTKESMPFVNTPPKALEEAQQELVKAMGSSIKKSLSNT